MIPPESPPAGSDTALVWLRLLLIAPIALATLLLFAAHNADREPVHVAAVAPLASTPVSR